MDDKNKKRGWIIWYMFILMIIIVGLQDTPAEKTLEEKYWDMQYDISKLEFRLYAMKQALTLYEMDIEARDKNLTVEYFKLPDSEMWGRIEYNGTEYNNINVKNLIGLGD